MAKKLKEAKISHIEAKKAEFTQLNKSATEQNIYKHLKSLKYVKAPFIFKEKKMAKIVKYLKHYKLQKHKKPEKLMDS